MITEIQWCFEVRSYSCSVIIITYCIRKPNASVCVWGGVGKHDSYERFCPRKSAPAKTYEDQSEWRTFRPPSPILRPFAFLRGRRARASKSDDPAPVSTHLASPLETAALISRVSRTHTKDTKQATGRTCLMAAWRPRVTWRRPAQLDPPG